jgi:hypothetical protein
MAGGEAMMSGTLVLRFRPDYGWQVFDWIPASFAIDKPALKIIRHRDGHASLLRITGSFARSFRRKQFCKAPHKLVCWPHPEQQRLAA